MAAVFSQELIKSLFDYDSETGIFRNKITRNSKAVVGAICGKRRNDGYLSCSVNYKTAFLHRLAWIYVHGEIPCGMEIDHINGVRDDNRISNLRLATHAENGRNAKMNAKNKSGYRGVSWSAKRGKWYAFIQHDKKTRYLGCYRDKLEAAEAYKKAATELHGDFVRVS